MTRDEKQVRITRRRGWALSRRGSSPRGADVDEISSSYIERQNLTMRMSMRRFTRLTNAFSKKFENHYHSLVLYFCWYNWVRKHKAQVDARDGGRTCF
jgi:hypothetical protein